MGTKHRGKKRVKSRHHILFYPEDWANLKLQAQAAGVSVSELIYLLLERKLGHAVIIPYDRAVKCSLISARSQIESALKRLEA